MKKFFLVFLAFSYSIEAQAEFLKMDRIKRIFKSGNKFVVITDKGEIKECSDCDVFRIRAGNANFVPSKTFYAEHDLAETLSNSEYRIQRGSTLAQTQILPIQTEKKIRPSKNVSVEEKGYGTVSHYEKIAQESQEAKAVSPVKTNTDGRVLYQREDRLVGDEVVSTTRVPAEEYRGPYAPTESRVPSISHQAPTSFPSNDSRVQAQRPSVISEGDRSALEPQQTSPLEWTAEERALLDGASFGGLPEISDFRDSLRKDVDLRVQTELNQIRKRNGIPLQQYYNESDDAEAQKDGKPLQYLDSLANDLEDSTPKFQHASQERDRAQLTYEKTVEGITDRQSGFNQNLDQLIRAQNNTGQRMTQINQRLSDPNLDPRKKALLNEAKDRYQAQFTELDHRIDEANQLGRQNLDRASGHLETAEQKFNDTNDRQVELQTRLGSEISRMEQEGIQGTDERVKAEVEEQFRKQGRRLSDIRGGKVRETNYQKSKYVGDDSHCKYSSGISQTDQNGNYQSCKGTKTLTDTAKLTNQIGGQLGAQAVQYQGAQNATQAHRNLSAADSYDAAADTARFAGYTQGALGAANLGLAALQYMDKKKHEEREEELRAASRNFNHSYLGGQVGEIGDGKSKLGDANSNSHGYLHIREGDRTGEIAKAIDQQYKLNRHAYVIPTDVSGFPVEEIQAVSKYYRQNEHGQFVLRNSSLANRVPSRIRAIRERLQTRVIQKQERENEFKSKSDYMVEDVSEIAKRGAQEHKGMANEAKGGFWNSMLAGFVNVTQSVASLASAKQMKDTASQIRRIEQTNSPTFNFDPLAGSDSPTRGPTITGASGASSEAASFVESVSDTESGLGADPLGPPINVDPEEGNLLGNFAEDAFQKSAGINQDRPGSNPGLAPSSTQSGGNPPSEGPGAQYAENFRKDGGFAYQGGGNGGTFRGGGSGRSTTNGSVDFKSLAAAILGQNGAKENGGPGSEVDYHTRKGRGVASERRLGGILGPNSLPLFERVGQRYDTVEAEIL